MSITPMFKIFLSGVGDVCGIAAIIFMLTHIVMQSKNLWQIPSGRATEHVNDWPGYAGVILFFAYLACQVGRVWL